MQLFLFYLFGTVAVVASLFVIGQRNPMYSVLLLIASFGGLAGLYLLLDAPFVAVIQIIIYAGAIMVLFLFVVMLLNAGQEEQPTYPTGGPRRFGAVLALLLACELIWAFAAVQGVPFAPGRELPTTPGAVRDIGRLLFTRYGFAFEVTSILILVAMLGAVVLARREP